EWLPIHLLEHPREHDVAQVAVALVTTLTGLEASCGQSAPGLLETAFVGHLAWLQRLVERVPIEQTGPVAEQLLDTHRGENGVERSPDEHRANRGVEREAPRLYSAQADEGGGDGLGHAGHIEARGVRDWLDRR